MRDILIFLYIFVIPWPYFFVPEAVGLKLQRVFFGHVLILSVVFVSFVSVCTLLVARDSSMIQKRMHVV